MSWTWVERKVHLTGSQFYPYQNMGSYCTRERSEMLSVCGTDGTSIYLPTVSVGKGSPSSMLLAAQLVGSQLSDMSSGISPQTCLLRYATMSIEPTLLLLTSEQLQHKTASVEDGGCTDICAQGFCGDRQQLAFFDIRVFNPHAPSCGNSSLPSLYRRHEGILGAHFCA